MLRKAQERVAEHRLTNVDVLAVMDAQQLGFPDRFFDVVVAQYVITAVPDPEATLDEFARVVRPGGEIILVNHLGAESRPAPRFRALVRAGGAPARLAAGIRLGAPRAVGRAPRRRAVLERRAMPPLGHFSLIRFGQARRRLRGGGRGGVSIYNGAVAASVRVKLAPWKGC